MLHPLHSTHLPPRQFTNPFAYEPHPLVREAVSEVRAYLLAHPEWSEELSRGKMFGVLVVEAPSDVADVSVLPSSPNGLYYLAAFSGLLHGTNRLPYFVPPIFDLLPSDGYFQQEQARIDALSLRLDTSQDEEEKSALRTERRQRSEALQDWLFHQFVCANARGERSDVPHIFASYYRSRMLHPEHFERNARTHHIPSGTGECCAPKLLQYAFLHHLRPLCMGEFWVGASTEGTLRREGHFYPACESKCRPLLSFMLLGLDVAPDPRAALSARRLAATRIVYADEALLVLFKPSGVLSVPGRQTDQPSVLDWLTAQGQTYYFPVHRLDQDTSGLLVVARDKTTYTQLQSAFSHHEVEKTYLAVLQGVPCGPERGEIRLPLAPDPDHRPLQRVDLEHGKTAVTTYRLLHTFTLDTTTYTVVEFRPTTGRTHQLRLHAAHPMGLDCPIAGDPLYGHPSPHFPSLCLHAAAITFRHPVSGQLMQLHAEPPFSTSGPNTAKADS